MCFKAPPQHERLALAKRNPANCLNALRSVVSTPMEEKTSMRTLLSHAAAYAEKDLHIQLRFKVEFVANTFLPALINLGLFGTVFFGFFKSGAPSGSELSSNDFVAFVLLAALGTTVFKSAFSAFQNRFASEKYWQTAQSILASPLSTWSLLLGVSAAELVKFSIVSVVFLTLSYIFWPVSILQFVGATLLLGLLYLAVSGFSLLRGALFLANENYDPIINYFMIGTAYVSCFYYPLTFLPSFLQPLAEVNPLYYIVNSIRSVWLGYPLETGYLAIGVIAGILSPLAGTVAFRRVWRNQDITGY
jgi:ABC-2 type transport system permease protein